MIIEIDFSYAIDGFYHSVNYYRSETPMNHEAMPAATATGITATSYTDVTPVANKDYYIRFGSVRSGVEKISNEIIVSTFPAVPWENVVTLLNFESGLVDVTGKRNWTSSDVNVAKVVDSTTLWGSKVLSIAGTDLTKYIHTPDSADFAFGSADFGIEASIFLISKDSFHTIISKRQNFGVQHSFCFYFFNNNFVFEYSTNGSTVISAIAPFSLSLSQKYDVQCIRSGSSLKIAVDGTILLDHNIATASLFNSSERIVIGQLNSSLSGGYLNGYIDEIRVTKGYAPPIKAKKYQFKNS